MELVAFRACRLRGPDSKKKALSDIFREATHGGFVIFSDLHAHDYRLFNSVDESGVSARVILQAEVLRAVTGGTCDAPITSFFLGDLFHLKNHIDVSVYNTIAWSCEQSKIFLLAGNHDQYDKNGNITTFGAFNPTVAQSFISYSIRSTVEEEISIVAIPYCSDLDKFKATLGLAMMNKPKIVFIHQMVNEVKLPHGTGLLKGGLSVSDLPKNILIISGHVHVPQDVSSGTGSHVRYIGAVMPQSFADEGVPGTFYTCIVDDWRIGIHTYYLNVPRFYTLEVGDLDLFHTEIHDGVEDDDEQKYLPHDCFRIQYSNEKELSDIKATMREFELEKVKYQHISKTNKEESAARTFTKPDKITENRMIEEYVDGNSTVLDKSVLKSVGEKIVIRSKHYYDKI